MKIKKSKGCLYAIINDINTTLLNQVPDNYKNKQKIRDNNKYHITIINSKEINNLEYSTKELDIKYINLGLSKLIHSNYLMVD